MGKLNAVSTRLVHGLDEKECFIEFVNTRSIPKVVEKFTKNGNLSIKTGKPWDGSAVRMAAYRWMLRNPEEAREILRKSGGSPHVDNDKSWARFLMGKAWQTWRASRGQFRNWVRDMGYEEIAKEYLVIRGLLLEEFADTYFDD